MNKHEKTIGLVKKWLDNPDSVSKEQLKLNRESALSTALPAALPKALNDAAACSYDAHANYDDTEYSDDALYAYAVLAADAAYVDAADVSYYWVKGYEKLAQKRINDGMDKRRG